MPRRVGLAAAAVLALGASLPSATAQTLDGVAVRVAAISPWTAPDRPLGIALRLRNAAETAVEGLSVRVSIFSRVLSRSGLRSALDRGPTGEPIALTTEDVPPVGAGESRVVEIARELGALATSFRPGGSRAGVYPMRIDVSAPRGTVARFHTAMVFFTEPPETRLNVVWLWPVHRPAAFARDAGYDADAVRATLDPDRLSRAVAVLAQRPAPVTLAPTGLLLDTLADLADGFVASERGRISTVEDDHALARRAGDALGLIRRAAAAPAEVASVPYARASVVALVHGGLARDAARQVTQGRARVERLLGRAPTAGLLVPAGYRVDARAASTLAVLGVRRLALDPSTLPAQPSGPFEAPLFGPSRPVAVQGPAGTTFEALLVDRDVRAMLAGGSETDRVVLAQNVLAETASAFHELPALASARLLVIASDEGLPPATAGALLGGIQAAPWIRLRTASEALDALPPQGQPIPLPLDAPGPDPILGAAAAARRALDVLSRVVPDPTPQEDVLERLILAAESIDFEAAPRRGIGLAQAARQRARATLGKIRAPNRQVTLTSRAGEVPVTVINDTGLRIRIRVRLDSSKVLFPRGETRVVEAAERVHTLSFPVEARATGSFPIAVLLETPDGRNRIGQGRVVVRSTAVSAVTLMATGGGALFLLVAWARRLRRSRATP